MRKFLATLLTLLISMVMAAPSRAATSKLKGNERVTGNLQIDGTVTAAGVTNSGNATVTGTQAVTGAVTMGSTLAVTGNTTVGGTLGVTGNTTVGGTLGVTGAVTLTVPLTAANIQTGSAKRQVFVAYLSPNTGAAADGTVYRQTIFPGRAGTVTRISYGAQTAPTVGTDTIKVLKGSSSGNTMLSTATVDANGITANQVTTASLTATSADLGVAASGAGSCIYCEYSAGTQTVDAIGVTVTVEFEPTDF